MLDLRRCKGATGDGFAGAERIVARSPQLESGYCPARQVGALVVLDFIYHVSPDVAGSWQWKDQAARLDLV